MRESWIDTDFGQNLSQMTDSRYLTLKVKKKYIIINKIEILVTGVIQNIKISVESWHQKTWFLVPYLNAYLIT